MSFTLISGYFGNGEQCMFQSVCSNNRGGCHPLATCIDNPGKITEVSWLSNYDIDLWFVTYHLISFTNFT